MIGRDVRLALTVQRTRALDGDVRAAGRTTALGDPPVPHLVLDIRDPVAAGLIGLVRNRGLGFSGTPLYPLALPTPRQPGLLTIGQEDRAERSIPDLSDGYRNFRYESSGKFAVALCGCILGFVQSAANY